jgi:arylsulfatase A-like enzyme
VPANFGYTQPEPEVLTARRKSLMLFGFNCQGKGDKTRDFSEEQLWRLYIWNYYRLCEQVDRELGVLLDALREQGLQKDTVILFTSDHGDMLGAHHMRQKQTPYDECARIPYIVTQPGVTREGRVDETHLINNGIDLMPTLCDYAGVEPPENCRGLSTRPIAEGQQPDSWRDDLVCTTKCGTLLRTARFKYVRCPGSEKHPEMLFDLDRDPGEMKNLAGDPEYRDVLEQHRKRLAKHTA